MYKRISVIFLASMILLSGCGKKGNKGEQENGLDISIPTADINSEEDKEPEVDLTGLGVNPLTGLYIDEEQVNKRPFAVVINNLPKALPQSGIAQADIIYEVLAEGGITRMIAVFKEFDSEKIGSVRSTRSYFLDFAVDNDAIFVHHGGSEQGYADIRKFGYPDLDGMALEGTAFIRDPERKNKPGMYEHSSFTSAAMLKDAADVKGYRTELEDSYEGQFNFYEKEEEMPEGQPAVNITVPFAPGSQVGYFEYDEENQVYLRYQNGSPHMDSEIDAQIKVDNIIVQTVSMRVIDDVGRRDVDLVGSGSGYLITKGQIYEIKWAKTNRTAPTEWFDSEGNKLKISKGKTWICVFQNTADIIVETGISAEAPAEGNSKDESPKKP